MKLSELYAIMGTVSYPVGITLIITQEKFINLGIGLGVIGIVCFLVATLIARNEQKQSSQVQRYLLETLKIIKDEIRGLRQDLRNQGSEDGRDNTLKDKT